MENPYKQCSMPAEHIPDPGSCEGDQHNAWEEGYAAATAQRATQALREIIAEELRGIIDHSEYHDWTELELLRHADIIIAKAMGI